MEKSERRGLTLAFAAALCAALIAVSAVACHADGPDSGPRTSWQRVGMDLRRFPVPGGWVYHCKDPTGGSTVFVPAPKSAAGGGR